MFQLCLNRVCLCVSLRTLVLTQRSTNGHKVTYVGVPHSPLYLVISFADGNTFLNSLIHTSNKSPVGLVTSRQVWFMILVCIIRDKDR